MHDVRASRWDLMAFHEPLGKDLARFKAAGGAIGAERCNAGRTQAIADSRGDGGFRAENDEIDRFLFATLSQRFGVRGRDVPVFTARCGAGISGRRENSVA